MGLYLNIIKIRLHSAACFDGVVVIDESLRVANGLGSPFLSSMPVDHLKQKISLFSLFFSFFFFVTSKFHVIEVIEETHI